MMRPPAAVTAALLVWLSRTTALTASRIPSATTTAIAILTPRLPRHVHEVRVAGNGGDHLRGISARLELLERVTRVARLEIGITLVVEVMNEARDPPELHVLAVLAGVSAHGGLHSENVLSQRV